MSRSVDFWYLRISRNATVPGRYRCGSAAHGKATLVCEDVCACKAKLQAYILRSSNICPPRQDAEALLLPSAFAGDRPPRPGVPALPGLPPAAPRFVGVPRAGAAAAGAALLLRPCFPCAH